MNWILVSELVKPLYRRFGFRLKQEIPIGEGPPMFARPPRK